MSDEILRVNCWEIRPRPDHAYGVYDEHGLVAGPFGTRREAILAAIKLPRPVREEAGAPVRAEKSVA